MTEEIIRVEWKRGGKAMFADFKMLHGKWHKLNRKGGWSQAVGQDERRVKDYLYEKSPTGQLMLALEFAREDAKAMRRDLDEVKALVSPASTENLLESLDINAETILRPDYLHPNAEAILGGKIPSYRVFGRPEIAGDRHYLYAIPNPDGSSARSWLIQRPLPGVTSIIKKTCPTPPSLVKWKASFPGGIEAANEFTDIAAKKGTIMHSIFADLVNDLVPEFDSTEWHRYIDIKITRQGIREPYKYHGEWSHFMRKAILSFLQWVEDYEVTFILMEIALVSEALGYAGQIDVVCEMNDRIYTKPVVEIFPIKKAKASHPKRQAKVAAAETAGQLSRHWEVVKPFKVVQLCDSPLPVKAGGDMEIDRRREPNMDNILENKVFNPRRRVNAIVDFKSGEHSYDTHHFQLGFYVPLLREAFPNLNLEGAKAWNWHPTDWSESKQTFSYKFVDQTNKLKQRRTECLLELYNMDYKDDIPSVLEFVGKPKLGAKPSNLVQTVEFAEHWESTLHLAMDMGLEMD